MSIWVNENGVAKRRDGGSSGGSDITVDAALSTTSENPVQNKAITSALADGKIKFGIDASGNYGYIKDGADTVTPFKKAATGTATAADVLSGKTFSSAAGEDIEGSIIKRTASDKWTTYTNTLYSAGYYENNWIVKPGWYENDFVNTSTFEYDSDFTISTRFDRIPSYFCLILFGYWPVLTFTYTRNVCGICNIRPTAGSISAQVSGTMKSSMIQRPSIVSGLLTLPDQTGFDDSIVSVNSSGEVVFHIGQQIIPETMNPGYGCFRFIAGYNYI